MPIWISSVSGELMVICAEFAEEAGTVVGTML